MGVTVLGITRHRIIRHPFIYLVLSGGDDGHGFRGYREGWAGGGGEGLHGYSVAGLFTASRRTLRVIFSLFFLEGQGKDNEGITAMRGSLA